MRPSAPRTSSTGRVEDSMELQSMGGLSAHLINEQDTHGIGLQKLGNSGRYGQQRGYNPNGTDTAEGSIPPSISSTIRVTQDETENTSMLRADETEHGLHSPRVLQNEFKPYRQLFQLLISGALRWFISAILIAGIILTIFQYMNMPVISSHEKQVFDALTTGLLIALGLNLDSSLKSLILDLRWRILNWKIRPLKEIDFILNSDSMMNLIRYAACTGTLTAIFYSAFLIILRLGAQVLVASVALTFKAEVTSEYAITQSDRPVWVSNFSSFATAYDSNPNYWVQQATAQSLGETSSNYFWEYANNTEDGLPEEWSTTWSSTFADYWKLDNESWRYVFFNTPPLTYNESQPPYGPSEISIYTNRSIDTSATCMVLPLLLVSGHWQIAYSNDSIRLPFPYLDSSTTFIYANYTAYVDDDRSAWIQAIQTGSIDAANNSNYGNYYFSCFVNVSEVTNAKDPITQVPSDVARTAAAAIALQGYTDTYVDYQYRIYEVGTPWGEPQNTSENMAYLVSQFAVGVLVAASYQNPMAKFTDVQPQEGLAIVWEYRSLFIIVLSLIGGLQLVLFVGSAFFSNGVPIPDEDALSIAHQLSPFIKVSSVLGSNISSNEIITHLSIDGKGIGAYVIRKDAQGKIVGAEIEQEPHSTIVADTGTP